MKRYGYWLLIVGLVLGGTSGVTLAQQAVAYRWTDGQGVVHMTQQPPENYGYSVINPNDGLVIRTVPAPPTPAEIKAAEVARKLAERQAAAQAQQIAIDQAFLARYPSLSDLCDDENSLISQYHSALTANQAASQAANLTLSNALTAMSQHPHDGAWQLQLKASQKAAEAAEAGVVSARHDLEAARRHAGVVLTRWARLKGYAVPTGGFAGACPAAAAHDDERVADTHH